MSEIKHPKSELRVANSQGFILLEVLVAMSMILGLWISSARAYQRLTLTLVQQEAQRSQIRKEFDAFEIQEHSRSSVTFTDKDLNNDFARVPGRHRALRTTTQPALKDKR